METVESGGRREFLISRTWIQAVVLVVVCGFFVLGLLAYRTYMAHPPVPARVVDASGNTLFTSNTDEYVVKFDDRKGTALRLAGSIQPRPARGGRAVDMRTGEVRSRNNWIKTGS